MPFLLKFKKVLLHCLRAGKPCRNGHFSAILKINNETSHLIRMPRQDLMSKWRMAEISHLWADWYLIYTLFTPFNLARNTPLKVRQRYDQNTVRLPGQKISVERKALKIRRFEDLSNGFTPRLHLLKVNYPMNDESTLLDAGCFFYG